MEQLSEALAYTALGVSIVVAAYQHVSWKREELIEQQVQEVRAVMNLLVDDARPLHDSEVGWVMDKGNDAILLTIHRTRSYMLKMPSAVLVISKHRAPSYDQAQLVNIWFGPGFNPSGQLMKLLGD